MLFNNLLLDAFFGLSQCFLVLFFALPRLKVGIDLDCLFVECLVEIKASLGRLKTVLGSCHGFVALLVVAIHFVLIEALLS